MFTGLFIDAFIISPYITAERADFKWNIAGMGGTPNVLSELFFNDLKADGYGIKLAKLNRINDNWAFYVELDYSSAEVDDGLITDSDYIADNRQGLIARSVSSPNKSDIEHESFLMGVKTRWFNQKNHYWTASLGYKRKTIDIRITDGQETYPGSGAINGLNSSYDSEFKGLTFGFTTEHVFPWGAIGLQYEVYDVEYEAEANWNLRSDFAHPISFEHLGTGDGYTATFSYSYIINRTWDVYASVSRTEYDISRGHDRTFFADGSHYSISLNEVDYESESAKIGIHYIF